ncbi:MAG TPA: multidrug efflux RND transporter permease subunit [Candidatus Binatus sp.]|uniref:multidrug efflux RND transporter permease subunit n=1 Tax=Candidatus Binatus sp. TaxID=2811406 RepID=UPI002B474BB4|nr:multidrug efflux RND transporter permease subunit [Candidatus Binatus sp.]HKN11772.1 multidrug efflux RND transporter permease subunit [Candidatus Binatus sp.]
MSISEPFIRKPVATTLLTIALALAGAIAFRLLPVAPLPQVEFPTIQVQAALPGASPETMASSVATPLERQFGRIAGLTELTSTSYLGATAIVLQFDLNRNIDAAARDVQAAINAAAGQLPTTLPSKPTYRKVNPADAPILILALTSNAVRPGLMYDAADSILEQKLSQIEGVGQVSVGGSALPGVRVELNPTQMSNLGVGLEDVRTVLAAANANRPKGEVADDNQTWGLSTTDQLLKAEDYQPLIVRYANGSGAAVQLSDIALVRDSVENVRAAGMVDGKPAVLIIVFRQPGANIIDTVDRVYAALPQLRASISPAINLAVVMDRTTTIRASVRDVEFTLLISISLVIMVVFLFLRNLRATLIPGIVVPLSLIGTFGIMYLCGYSLDNLSLMALTICTGFVVDDAIVVIENISRYREQGMSPFEAALKGAAGIGFTVISISISLVAVFIPILLMAGIVGRLFREFAVTLSAAVMVSLVISLTTTPMMAAHLLKPHGHEKHNRWYLASERFFKGMLDRYESSLLWVLDHQPFTLMIALATLGLSIFLFRVVPKGFFPQQDTGRLMGAVQADQDTSFQAMKQRLTELVAAIDKDPAVDNVIAFTGGNGATNTANMYIALKPLSERKINADLVIGRIRKEVAHIAGVNLYLQEVQDLRIGGRMSNAQYQFTLQSDDLGELNQWAPKVLKKLRTVKILTDVSSDQQNSGLEANVVVDRDTASRLGLSQQAIDDTLYDAFGQRQVSTMYTPLNQYHVVMEVAPQFWQNPDSLDQIYVRSSTGQLVRLGSFTHFSNDTTALAVNHQGQFPSVTISFNLAPGVALGDAVDAIAQAEAQIKMPAGIRGTFQGTAQAFQDSLKNEGFLIMFALGAVYIVLGILYESYIHPITILSTLPSAGVGAILALLLFHFELSIIALIGIILLIGIVKKNAIMMIDFALEAQRREDKSPHDAIYQACVLRFRPIMMTTAAALLGGLPLALGNGTGSEMRRPLGIAIVGGLLVSQVLTLYTTPVIYLYLDRVSAGWSRLWRRLLGRPRTAPAESHVAD